MDDDHRHAEERDRGARALAYTQRLAVGVSLAMTLLFFGLCLAVVAWMFKTGYRLKS